MKKKTVIGIAVAVVLVAAVIPVAYTAMQRAAITSLEFNFNKFELTDADFSDTTTARSLERIFDDLEDPSETTLTQVVSLQNDISSVSSPEGFVLDMVANTKLTFSMFVDVHNPSSFEAVIDRAQIKVSINNRELPNALSINQQARIPAGEDTTLELSGITLSGKEIANMIVNLASNDFILTLDFAITSYFPTLFGEVPILANLNLDIYLIPPKPSFDAYGDGFKQAGYNTNSYELLFANNSPVSLTGKFQVGVMKGNALSKIGICDPACIAPVDSGIATFIRINLGNLVGIQVFEKENVSIKPGKAFTLTVDNPELRNEEDSAFIIRWNPDYDRTPYTIHTEMAGIESTSQGEFSSHSLTTVKKIAYNLVRNFGYVGSKEFVSPDKSTFLSLSSSAASATAGSKIEFSGRLTDLAGNGIADVQVYIQDEDSFSSDEYLGLTYTDSDGQYSYSWKAKSTDFFDSTIEVFASYKGSESYDAARSQTLNIDILQYQTTPTEPEKVSTSLSLQSSSYSTYEGERITFTGRLTTQNGDGISNARVYIKDEDTGSGDDELGTVITGSEGSFTFNWDATQKDPLDNVVEVYAVFDGSAYYYDSRSNQIDITVYEQQSSPPQGQQFQATTITLTASSTSPNEGNLVVLSGTLISESGNGVAGALIYIKDEDTGSGDDLIGTINTDSNGNYSFQWSAEPKDPFDNVVEVYAVFEGSSSYEESRSQQINIEIN